MIRIEGVDPSTRKPGAYIEISTSGAKTGLPVVTDRVLLIGHKLAAGTKPANVPVQVFSESEARTYCGNGSPLALMAKAALEQNPYIHELWLLPITENGAGTAATGSIVFTTSSLQAGTLYVYIGRHLVTVAVTATMTQDQIALAVRNVIQAQTWLPLSASVVTNTVTLTARCKGLGGNDWNVQVVYSTSGLTAVVTDPAGGASDGDQTTALTEIFGAQFDLIATELNSAGDLDELAAQLALLAGPMEQRPGLAMAGLIGTLGDATTLGNARNSPYLLLPYCRGTRTHPSEIAAAVAAAFAGESDRARPLNNVILAPVVPPDKVSFLLTRTEQESCLANGVMPLQVRGSDVTIVRSVTTYVRNAAGDDDDTLLDAQTLRVLFYFQYALGAKFRAELGRVKLAAVARTPNTTDPEKVRSLAMGVALQMQNELGYLQGVEDDADRFIFELDPLVTGRLNGRVPARIVPGLHVLAASIDLVL